MGITEEFRANNEALSFNDEVRSLIFRDMGEDEIENLNDFAVLSQLKGALTGDSLNGIPQDIFTATDNEGFNILLLAASLGFAEKVSVIIDTYQQFLQSQGNNNEGEITTKLLQMIETADNNGMTALHWACHKGYGSVLAKLVSSGGNINSVTQNSSTPLILASSCGHIEIVSFLLNCTSQKVDVNACDRDGKTALIWACSCGFSSIATLLLKFGADIELKDSSLYSALMWAASRGEISSLAEQKNKVDVVRTLLDHNANVEVRNRVGYTPLILAAFFCHLETCKVLIEKGKAEIEARDNNDNTALQSACRRKLTAFDAKRIIHVVTYLIEHGANVETANALGNTCLISASQLGNLDVVAILVQQGKAYVNALDKVGCSALMYACREANFEVARFLLMNGADLSIRCHLGSTALEYISDDDMEQLLAKNIETYNATKTFPEIDPRMLEYSERVKRGGASTINNAARILTQRLNALTKEQKTADDNEFLDIARSSSTDGSVTGSSKQKAQASPRCRPPTAAASSKQQQNSNSNSNSRNPTPNRSRIPTPTPVRSASPRSVSPRGERPVSSSNSISSGHNKSSSSASVASISSLSSNGSSVKKRSPSPFNLSATNRPLQVTKGEMPPLPPFANLSASVGPGPLSLSRSASPAPAARSASLENLAVASPVPKKVVVVAPRSTNGKQQKAEPPKPKQGSIKKEGNSKFLGDLNWKSRFFILTTSATGQTLLSYVNGAVSNDTFKGMTISESTGLCNANTDQKGIYDLKSYTVQSLEDNFIALIYRGDALQADATGKDKDAPSKKGERDIHLKFDIAKEKRDWTDSFKAHLAYGASLVDGKK